MKSPKQFWILSILQLLVTASFIAAQTSSSSLQGTVTDPSGSAISGASVMLSSNESKLERTMVTGTQGEYRVLALSAGTYALTVTAKGFSRYEQTDLQILAAARAGDNVQCRVV